MGIWNLSSTYDAEYIPKSAVELIQYGHRKDGVYLIDLPTVGPTWTFCLLDKKWDGGGWMLAMKSTVSTTFNYSSSYWTTDNTLNPTNLTGQDVDAKYEVMNKFAAKDIMARWPDILIDGGSLQNTGTWTWLQNNFNSGSRQTLISWFASVAGNSRFISAGKSFSGWASGTFSSQAGYTWYGFNYVANANSRVRWGFGWNNEADAGSNDVSGGIGMDTNFGSYSAGDRIACCEDTTGINRSARVEIYVR